MLLAALALSAPLTVVGQSKVEVAKTLNYRQPVTPSGMDHYQYSSYFYNGKRSYNLKGFELNSLPYAVQSLKVNPAGASYALLGRNGSRSCVRIFDVLKAGAKPVYEFAGLEEATALCYTADSRNLVVADGQGSLAVYETRAYELLRRIPLPVGFVPTELTADANNYFVAATGGFAVVVVNMEANTVRTRIDCGGMARAAAFSDDGAYLGILAGDHLDLYSTNDFTKVQSFGDLGGATSFSFHPDGKYVAVALNGRTLKFLNLTDPTDFALLTEPAGGVSRVQFLRDGKNQIYLSYNAEKALKYQVLKGFLPNYTRRLRDELNQRMLDWCKRKPGETDEEFNARVNEETKQKQKKLFANQISTSLAGDLLAQSTVTLGKYNPDKGTLVLNLDNMPPIYLRVPREEVADFSDASQLEFSDAVYGLTKDDRFELIYAKVHNRSTGKEYVFDNLEQQSLDFLQTDDSFVPLDLIQQAGREEVTLERIKKEIVAEAKQKQLISDHTNIQVRTDVVSDIDAAGRRIKNYKIEFSYTVDADYSVKEDFPAGQYQLEKSQAAMSTLRIIRQALEQEFSQYIKAGKKVAVRVTGSADALPINGVIAYDGCYGDFNNEPYYLDGNLSNITVTRKEGIRQNEQLAFMRAQGVKNYIEKNISSLGQMDVQYISNIELADGCGGQFRRINVTLTFFDAF